MRVVESFPHPVREIENSWIPMPDGGRLAARTWLPAGAESAPVPAILEYIPYRKRDFTRGRDEPMYRYFAGHGYAAVRVDLRGSGDSDGVLVDEYSEQELADAEAVIGWIAAQPWCSGRVGMMGISWGGFNALQVAARRPPALGAVISLCSTDDRYADDAHYMGGCLLNENLTWGSVLLTFNAYPPDPAIVGERWREMWRQRLDHATLFPAEWMRHPFRDDYWRRGSVCEDYPAIACPVWAVGGWADGYSNAVPRLVAGLAGPRRGLVGPWAHTFPQDGVPGPAIGFLQEALRWWDRWLQPEPSPQPEEPPYRVWMQESVPPRSFYAQRPGRWVAEDSWPSPRVLDQSLALEPGRLVATAEVAAELTFTSPQTTGLAAGEWCGFGAEGEAPLGQREDDGKSLTFDGEPLAQRLEVLGAPRATLELAVDQPVALVAARLCDVAPDGASTRVTYGLLNLTHRDSHQRPAPLEPGRRYRVQVPLNHCAHAFPPGHRLRLALSTTYWPIAWPAPEPFRLTVFTLGSALVLPVRTPRASDAALRPFPAPEAAPTPEHTILHAARLRRTIERDLRTHRTTYTLESDGGDFAGAAVARVHAIGLDLGHTLAKRFSIDDHDPLSAVAEVEQRALLRRDGWEVRVETRTRLS
ncbi:MAG TPA: CocE/NonD family hydrolase, partial [Thermoanaerobaculia bacterium]|nr:CocE/NonD family hydrolase [Thermoanaerobaculia bacterium]